MIMRLKGIFFLAMSALTFGCTTSTVAPDSGGITGSVLPANGATKVYLIRANDTVKADIQADGTYEITDVSAGNYQLSAKPAAGFFSPIPGKIIINGGFTTQAYPIRMLSVSDSTAFLVTLQDSVLSGSPVSNASGDPGFSVTSGNYKFTFKLPKISGTDTFETATNQNLELEIIFNQQLWVAKNNQGNLVFSVNRFDPVTKRGDGTFSFTAVRSGENDLIGTKGKFQSVKLN